MKKNEFVKMVTEIVRRYEDKNGEKMFDVTLKETEAYLNAIKSAVIDSLADGDEISWPGFVKFSVGDVAARTARNPQTGESISVPAKKKVKIKTLGELKAAV